MRGTLKYVLLCLLAAGAVVARANDPLTVCEKPGQVCAIQDDKDNLYMATVQYSQFSVTKLEDISDVRTHFNIEKRTDGKTYSLIPVVAREMNIAVGGLDPGAELVVVPLATRDPRSAWHIEQISLLHEYVLYLVNPSGERLYLHTRPGQMGYNIDKPSISRTFLFVLTPACASCS